MSDSVSVIESPTLIDCMRSAIVSIAMRRETGKEWVVKVHRDEYVASHVGLEPCAVIRKGADAVVIAEV